MRYRKQGQTEGQSKDEALAEELVHGLIGGVDSGAPEILPEVLKDDDESNASVFGWSYTPPGLEACRSAGEVTGLYVTQRKSSAVVTLLRVLLSTRATRRKAICWFLVLWVTTLFNAFTGTLMVRGQAWIEKSQQFVDAESFWFLLPWWIAFVLMDLVMDALQSQSQYELRMLLQWQLQFALAHSIFTADSFYRLQTVMTNAAPETLICEDAFILVKQLIAAIAGVMRSISIFIFSAWFLWMFFPKLLYAGVVMAPVFLKVLSWSTPYTAEVAQVQITVRGALHFILNRVQSNAEEIALAGGGASELHSAEHTLRQHRESAEKQGFRTSVVETATLFTSFVLYLPIIYILVEDMIENNTQLVEAISHFGITNYLMFGWTSMISWIAAATWANLMAAHMLTMAAISQGYEAASKLRMLTAASDPATVPEQLIKILETGHRAKTALELRDVELRIEPSMVVLVRNVSFGLASGESMLVLGDTGIGKSTLLRGIQGLCMSGSGTVQRCRKDAMTCVPQKPFMYRASLRENLLYPWVERSAYIKDEEIWDALEAVNLKKEFAMLNLDKPMPWHDILSLGQQQRFGFARALLKRDSQLVLLDEATSAMDLRNERIVYALLRERFPCYVSAAHRRSVQQYHTHVLMLEWAKEGEGDARSTAHFMRAEDCHFASSSPEASAALAALDASAESEAGAAAAAGEEAPTEPPSAADHAADRTKDLLLSRGPEVTPPRMMVTLMRRIFFDIVVPIVWRRSLWQDIRPHLIRWGVVSAVQGLALTFFLMPLAKLQEWSQEKVRAELWGFIFQKALLFVPVSIVIVFTTKYTGFVLQRIAVVELQRHFVRLYFEHNMFYRLLLEGNVHDPAGRFTMWDFSAIVEFYSQMVGTLGGVVLGNMALVFLLHEVDSAVAVTVTKVMVAYMVVATVVFILTFMPVYPFYTRWIFEATRLHDSLVHVHGHAEAVALLQGCDIEKRRTSLMLDKCIDVGQHYVWWREYAQGLYFDAMFERVTKFLLYGLVWPLVISREVSPGTGVLVTTVMWKTVEKMLGIAAVFIGSPEGFGSMSRIWELIMEMNRLRDLADRQSTHRQPGQGGILLEQDDGTDLILELRDVTLRTPSRMSKVMPPLLQGMSLQLAPGQKLVVTGPSGIGKTSLIRMIAGIWHSGSGTIRRASDMRSFFIAQRPYVCIGTLRHQLLYPAIMRTDVSRERLEEVLHKVHLEHLLTSPGLGPECEEVNTTDRWWAKLSLGEVQRLAFARLLLKDKLHVAFLDEATSALSPGTEIEMYGFLRDCISSYISVAHRPEAQSFHSHILILSRGMDEAAADWRMLSIEERKRELGQA